MIDFLSYAFVQRALLTGTLLGVTCAVLSFFVVLGAPPLLSAAIFTTGVAWVIGWIGERTGVSEDTAIGVFFPAAMALGVVLISLSPEYRQDLVGYLFGNILSVGPGQVLPLVAVSAVTLGVLTFYFKELLFMGVDPEAARAAGVPVTALRFLLLSVLAVTIVASVKLVGIVLVSAFLVIPAATGQALARSLRAMLGLAVGTAIGSVLGGLWLSWLWDLPSGATIVLVSATLFFVAVIAGRLRGQAA